MPGIGSSPGPSRPRPPRPLATALALFALGLALPAASSEAAPPGSNEDLDALVQSTLEGVPAEKASEVVAWILEAYEGTTGYHGVSPGAIFQSGGAGQDLVLDTASGSLRNDDFGSNCSYAPIHLPQGATVTAFLMWVRDSNSTEESSALLKRFRIDGATGVQELASVVSSGATANSRVFSDFTISNGTVDNLTYWYFVYVCLPAYSDADGPTELRGLYVGYSI